MTDQHAEYAPSSLYLTVAVSIMYEPTIEQQISRSKRQ